MRRIYLDVCTLCRPFDDQNQIRIRLETDAVELILSHVRRQQIEMVISPAHRVEVEAITDFEEQSHLSLLLRELGSNLSFDMVIARQRATELVMAGLGVADAAHLAFAEQAQAEFVTVDDRLIKQCRRVKAKGWAGSPLAYCDKENLK